ncbi:MAG TPA: uroporphyrinogen decarboxylase family protein [Spirochaetia bacterium]|nr:uroporphyrinogen decarboxylase family protein [Spirochaetia bacterium]
MKPRENFLRLVSGKTPAWVPFTMDIGGSEGFTTAVQKRFEEETGAEDPAEYFDYDLRVVSLHRGFGGTNPRRWHPEAPASTEFDEWGIGHWAGGARDTYERMFPPLAGLDSVEAVNSFPEPIVDVGDTPEKVRALHDRGYPVIGYAGSIYEWSWWLRGMEQFMVDLLADPAYASAVIARVAGFTRRLALATAAAGIDVLSFYDDAGSQAGMQISPELWRSFVKPAWKGVLDAVRLRHPSTVFFLHSCGNIEAIVPDIVELGFHILHPIQPECMDAPALKRTWGHRIIPCATLGAQRTLSLSTAEEVRLETLRVMDVMAWDGRAIVCPSNRIQPETPWENIVAFARTARDHANRFTASSPRLP